MSQKGAVEFQLSYKDKSNHGSNIDLSCHGSDIERASAMEEIGFEDEDKIPADFSRKESVSNGTIHSRITNIVLAYFMKMRGIDGKKPPHPGTYEDMLASVIISFIGILLLSSVSYQYLEITFETPAGTPVIMLIGSFGATAVLVFDAYTAPLSQPKSVMLSHVLASLISVLVRLFGEATGMDIWTQAPLSVSLSIGAMRVFRCVHPPGGAVALIGIIGGPSVTNMGFGYILTCTGAAFICVCAGCLLNNLVPWRQYPLYWD